MNSRLPFAFKVLLGTGLLSSVSAVVLAVFPWQRFGLDGPEGMMGAAYFWMLAPVSLLAFVALAGVTVKHRVALPQFARVAGLAPIPLLCATIAVFLMVDRHLTNTIYKLEVRFRFPSETPTGSLWVNFNYEGGAASIPLPDPRTTIDCLVWGRGSVEKVELLLESDDGFLAQIALADIRPCNWSPWREPYKVWDSAPPMQAQYRLVEYLSSQTR